MDLVRLRVIAALAREGSVTGAARALHYAQPSVSHHLARLEAEAGVPLVRREGRGVRLTEAGALLAARAEEILGRVASAREELDALAGLAAGRVRLAAFPSALATLVPDVVASLGREHPGLGVGLVEAEPPEALSALRRGAVDVALVFEHDRSPADLDGLDARLVLVEQLYLVQGGGVPGVPDPGGAAGTGTAAGTGATAGAAAAAVDPRRRRRWRSWPTPPGSRAASGAGRTWSRGASAPASRRGSRSRRTTTSRSRRSSPRGWA